MSTVVFLGTFDPFHGAHIGQLLRAHQYRPFSEVIILVNKHPQHKPNATNWLHRVLMAELGLAAFDVPFSYQVVGVENSLAADFTEVVLGKVVGIDAVLEDLDDPQRLACAMRWPMLIVSVPGIEDGSLEKSLATLPITIRNRISYDYVSEMAIPMMNYDFDRQAFISRRIHSTYLRSGEN
jgi:cytidyltransferase-like protein